MSGFPNAAEEAGDEPLNLHKHIVKTPASTFFMRIDSDMHAGMSIYKGDLLVVDRSLRMRPSDIVVALDDGDLRLMRAREIDKAVVSVEVWGVVTHAVHQYRGNV